MKETNIKYSPNISQDDTFIQMKLFIKQLEKKYLLNNQKYKFRQILNPEKIKKRHNFNFR